MSGELSMKFIREVLNGQVMLTVGLLWRKIKLPIFTKQVKNTTTCLPKLKTYGHIYLSYLRFLCFVGKQIFVNNCMYGI